MWVIFHNSTILHSTLHFRGSGKLVVALHKKADTVADKKLGAECWLTDVCLEVSW